jgi:hypothetical protein
MDNSKVELRVGAHVLVQLGSELVPMSNRQSLNASRNPMTRIRQGCRIDIDTREVGIQIESGTAAKLRPFGKSSETVEVTLLDVDDCPPTSESVVEDDQLIKRQLGYAGRITIEDNGDSLTPGPTSRLMVGN